MGHSSRQMGLVAGLALIFILALAFQAGLDRSDPGSPEVVDPERSGALVARSAGTRVGYVVSTDETVLRAEPAADGDVVAPGIVFAVTAETDDGFEVLDPCNREGWLSKDDVVVGVVPAGDPSTFASAVFVVDPGHGLPDLGAVGPDGLPEADVNADVSARLVELLLSDHDVDWATGRVEPGATIPAVAVAVMTRPVDGPVGGNYEAGLTFRAELANSMSATALVSIHHNSSPDQHLGYPGSEAYVSVRDPESARLGGLIVEELRKGLVGFEADWAGAPGSGVISRVDEDGDDFYTVLRRSAVPAVIVEGAYISNPTEEALVATDVFRQAYAEGVYRALVRFVTTGDDPIPAPEPEQWVVDGPRRSMDDCHVPTP